MTDMLHVFSCKVGKNVVQLNAKQDYAHIYIITQIKPKTTTNICTSSDYILKNKNGKFHEIPD